MVDMHRRLADLLQGGQHFGLEEAGAQDRIRLVQANLIQHRLRRPDRDEGQGNAFAPAGLFRTVQHRREEGAGCQRVVLAVQQEDDAADAALFELREVVAHAHGGFAHHGAGAFGHAGLVLEGARYRTDGQAGAAGDVAQGDLAHARSSCRVPGIEINTIKDLLSRFY
jgi:hypothetical protein